MTPTNEGWSTAPLGSLIAPSKRKVDPTSVTDTPYLSLEHIESGTRRIVGAGTGADVSSTKAVFHAGDVLYGKLRPYLNKVARPEFDGICSTDILVFEENGSLDNGFLAYWLSQREVVDYAAHHMKGNSLPRVSFEDLGKFPISYPPIEEQRRIAAKLDDVLGRVAAARERLDRVPAILRRFRQSVLAAAVSGRLTADWRATNADLHSADGELARIIEERSSRNVRQKRGKRREAFDPKELPDIPTTWCWTTWRNLVDWTTYGFTRPMPHVAHGVPIITAKNVYNGEIDFSTADHTTRDAFNALSDKDRPQTGEILITKDGSLGRAAIVETETPFCINQSVALLRFGGSTGYVPYLMRVIESEHTQRRIEEAAEGTAIRHLSITAFAEFPVPFPPTTEQREIARRTDALLNLAGAAEKRHATADGRSDRIADSILARAFNGGL